MLILTRRIGEALVIGDDVRVSLLRLDDGLFQIGLDHPDGKTVTTCVYRETGEELVLLGGVVIRILNMNGNQVKIGIDAPRSISVHREEIYNKIQKEKLAA